MRNEIFKSANNKSLSANEMNKAQTVWYNCVCATFMKTQIIKSQINKQTNKSKLNTTKFFSTEQSLQSIIKQFIMSAFVLD